MDPLSRRLRQLYPSVQIRTSDSREFGTNHLLYIDDLKLLAKDYEGEFDHQLVKVRQHKPPLPTTQRAGRRYSHASLITTYLHDKYGLTIRDNEAIPKTIQHLRKLQNRSLYNVISTTKLHKLLFSRRELDSVDLEESTLWLRKSMLTPQEEAKLINLQDRNLQWMSSKKNHKKCGKYLDVEHLASKCDRLLHTDYVRRHNEVARRIHRTLAKELGVKNIKKVERYKIDDRKFTKNGWISYDMSIHTEKKVQFNRPDIIVADKRKNRITIVEIGITSQNNLVKTEMEKKDKYQDLRKQMKFQTFGNHDTEIVIIPWVMTYNFVLRELGVAATGITCECDPARKRQAANMDRGPPLKEREVHASARRPALPSAAPALAVACGA
ncbi:reverse transcriptase domain containing protein [Babesia caballi]|uniref:Reverse transcriptase domain containing protein n=1 Tax=Babesia caballi TaxID=5871 RepID=A0AAV4LQ58_BABCB|nr:reverse transcriptase domain containing protein [Babesia caballi]